MARTSETTDYGYIWHKYRPVILKLMIDAAQGPQEYRFSEHEFRRINPRQKSGFAFILFIHKCKAINNIAGSVLANDLLTILKQSKTAIELTDKSTYEIMLDKKFVLRIRKAKEADQQAELVADLATSVAWE